MEKKNLTVKTRMTQDRRQLSRAAALIECTFTDGDVSYRAVIVNLSMVGAFLSARHLPEKGSKVTITLLPPGAAKPMILPSRWNTLRAHTSD